MLRSVLIGYFVVWMVLLVACIRRREFCIVFSDSRRTRLFWLATFVFLNPLLTILYFVFGQIRSPQARPIRIARDVALVVAILGFLVNIPGLTHLWMQPFLGRSPEAGKHFDAHLAAIESANNTSTSVVAASSDNSRLACGRIAVIADSRHLLLHRIGSALVEKLKTVPAVETVEFYPDGAFPGCGQRAPDIFVRLHLDRIKETPIPYSLKLGAQIGVGIGRMPLPGMHSYYDQRTSSPLLDFDLQIQMRHTSTTAGYESARYSMAARNIANDLGETIAKTLGQWQDKYGLLPKLPGEFYGNYTANELSEPLKKLEPVLLGSYSGLLMHNETYLQFTLADEPVKAIEGLRDAMTALGWKELSSVWKSPHIELRLQKGDRRIHILQMASTI